MDRFEKLLSNNYDVVFFIALIEAILIVALISYIMYLRWCTKGEGRKLKNTYKGYSEILDKKESRIDYRKGAYNDVCKKQSIAQNERPTASSSRVESSGPISTNNPTRTGEQVNRSNSGWEEYIAQENEKRAKSFETKNDDGTVRNEIVFDLSNEKPVSAPIVPRYDYLESANSGQFRRLLSSDEKCFFRTWEENGIRKFEFHGNVDRALANINAIFDETCDIEGKQNGATNIINVEPGIIDNNLKVEKKAKIKLI